MVSSKNNQSQLILFGGTTNLTNMDIHTTPSVLSLKFLSWYFRSVRTYSEGNPKTYFKTAISIWRNRRLYKDLRRFEPSSSIDRYLQKRPEVFGVFVWPFVCSEWNVEEKIERIVNHFGTIDRMQTAIQLDLDNQLVLADLSRYSEGLKLVLDQPKWFMREGLFALNIFVGDFRAFTCAFSLYTNRDSSIDIYVGAIQGRSTPGALDLYRELTKHLCGIRPRDFLVESLRLFGEKLEVNRILAVSDSSRIHSHPYFKKHEEVYASYNQVWEERGGKPSDSCFYNLPSKYQKREISEIPSKKRSLYRKKLNLLEKMSFLISENLTTTEERGTI